MKRILSFWPIILLVALTVLFLGKTLTGSDIFVTPDFGQSDLLNIEYPTEFFNSVRFHEGKLPDWNPWVGSGYPQAGLPTGAFYPLNVLLYAVFPMPLAHYLVYASIFLTAGIGMYLYMRVIGVSRVGGAIAAISFAFSGSMIAQSIHHDITQTLSLLPFELWAAELYFKKKRPLYIFLLSLAVGGQILAGFFQMVLYSLLVLVAYILLRLWKSEGALKEKLRIGSSLAAGIALGFGIGWAQLAPSLELTVRSSRSSGVGLGALWDYPFPLIHVLTFLWPYLLGDPRNGSYPSPSENWGLFWENTSYIGLVPLALSVFAIRQGVKKHAVTFTLITILVIAACLTLGKWSPLFFLYHAPPLSWFRVPARWIMFVVFFLSALSALGYDHLYHKVEPYIPQRRYRTLAHGAILVSVIVPLCIFALGYHLRGDANLWLRPPDTALYLQANAPGKRIYSISTVGIWNNTFLSRGWKGQEPRYRDIMSALPPNWNSLFGIPALGAYDILSTQRSGIVGGVLNAHIKEAGGVVLIDEIGEKILDMESVAYVLSPYPIAGDRFVLRYTSRDSLRIRIYEHIGSLERARAVFGGIIAFTAKAQEETLVSDTFSPATQAIIEQNIPDLDTRGTGVVNIVRDLGNEVQLEASMSGDGLVVLSDSVFTGWSATLDGKPVAIIPANINSRGVFVPRGSHVVRFSYYPRALYTGIFVSIVSFVLGLIACFILSRTLPLRGRKK